MSIATRTGDEGKTGLLHGQRVAKDHPQIEAVGAFDELNVEVGAAKLAAHDANTREFLERVQGCLVGLMGEIACAEEDAERHSRSEFARLSEGDLAALDAQVASLESKGLKLDGWATPGSNASSLAFDRARVSARRAERCLAALPASGRVVRDLVLKWTNRLSDVLWLLARQAES